MSVKKTNTLNRFLGNLNRYKKSIDTDKIADVIGDIGSNVAREEYSTSSVIPNEIRKEIIGNSVEIIAVGEKLAFSEFGTGILGEGTYQGELPSKSLKLQFESPQGVQQSTDGWEYNYRKKQQQTTKDWAGFPAKAHMFNTSQRLQNELGEQIKKTIKGE